MEENNLIDLIQLWSVFITHPLMVILWIIIYLIPKLKVVKEFLCKNLADLFFGINQCAINQQPKSMSINENENVSRNQIAYTNHLLAIELTFYDISGFKFGLVYMLLIANFLYIGIQIIFIEEIYSNKCEEGFVCTKFDLESNLTCETNTTVITDDPYAFNCQSFNFDINIFQLRLIVLYGFAKLYLSLVKIAFNVSYTIFKKFADK